jgi:hypothetical protein
MLPPGYFVGIVDLTGCRLALSVRAGRTVVGVAPFRGPVCFDLTTTDKASAALNAIAPADLSGVHAAWIKACAGAWEHSRSSRLAPRAPSPGRG